jgi:hypothetical protein
MRRKLLKELSIDEISSVDRGAGQGCRVTFFKREDTVAESRVLEKEKTMQDELISKIARAERVQQSLREFAKRQQDPGQAHFSGYGEAVDKSGALELMSEMHRLEQQIAKTAAKPQAPPPHTAESMPASPKGGQKLPYVKPLGRVELPQHGADSDRWNGFSLDEQETMAKLARGEIAWNDPRVMKAHERERRAKERGRLRASGY